MGDRTGIEWTDATWNPVTGCTKVSPGCDHCYAETIAHRFAGTPAYPNAFDVTLRPERLDQPLRWRRPRRVFVNSMSDLFHDDIAVDYIAEIFAVMRLAPQHTFQILTKRHGRMRSLLNNEDFRGMVGTTAHRLAKPRGLDGRGAWPLPNVWLGVSVENQQWADIRVPALINTPAAVRFLSCEPLLGPVDLRAWPHLDEKEDGYRALDWVIVGGESGADARPMHPEWARQLRDQCVDAGTAFMFKQWGNWSPDPASKPEPDAMVLTDGRVQTKGDKCGIVDSIFAAPMANVGKRKAGRVLDGRTWDEFPKVDA